MVGIVGVPGSYGGFETLTDHLLDSAVLSDREINVYCESSIVDRQAGRYKGARLIPVNWRANGWQSIVHDTVGLWSASRAGGLILVLGTSATFWLPLLRRLFPRSRYLVNMAGLEWTRAKWGRIARALLKYNEASAARYAHVFIADNQGLVEYIKSEYGRDAVLIAYGGDQFKYIIADLSVFYEYDLPERYDFAMARAQVDNNLEVILAAYVTSGLPLVFVSNWDSSNFGREIRDRYAKYPNIRLVGPVYDTAKVKALQQRARLYVHGHSAGGTNPVLVEAMWAGLPTLAFDVSFNRHTTDGRAFYFNSHAELVALSTELTQDVLARCGQALREVAEQVYRWDAIRESYEQVVLSVEVK